MLNQTDNVMKDKIEILKHSIDRYDHYYDSVNNKGNLYLTLNTFLLGSVVTGYYSTKGIISQQTPYIVFFIWLSLASCIISIGFTLWAIMPYLSKASSTGVASVINFGNVSNIAHSGFKQLCDDMTEEKQYDNYLNQSYLLAVGLQKKFKRLQVATYLLGINFIFISIIIFKIL